MPAAPNTGELRKGTEPPQRRRASYGFDLLETVIRRSTYVLLALGGLAASLKLLRDVVFTLFGK
jgi:hypothetical protein